MQVMRLKWICATAQNEIKKKFLHLIPIEWCAGKGRHKTRQFYRIQFFPLILLISSSLNAQCPSTYVDPTKTIIFRHHRKMVRMSSGFCFLKNQFWYFNNKKVVHLLPFVSKQWRRARSPFHSQHPHAHDVNVKCVKDRSCKVIVNEFSSVKWRMMDFEHIVGKRLKLLYNRMTLIRFVMVQKIPFLSHFKPKPKPNVNSFVAHYEVHTIWYVYR